ncbi:MAG TPA: rod shape-determining protein MreC [Terracidiphilus sp.]|nr:rod shape-determining protein MreC [Terracidiphilus sp.]
MESFFIRYRNLLVLLVILLAQIVGLAMQVRRGSSGRNTLDTHDSSGVRLIRLWAETLVAPPERAVHSAKLGILYVWNNYFYLQNVRRQNEDLEKTIDRLRLEQAALLEDARQGQRLQAMLGFQEKYIYSTIPAQAIGTSGSEQSHVFYIDKGEDAHLKPDMAVITGDGIVGKIRDVFPHTSQVLAINDQTSGAGVILETTRIRGILRGNADGQLMIVGILADERIQPGEVVLTAGGDLVFPRGLPVGVVDKVVRDPDRGAFIDVMVKPAAHLDRLDEVLVITSTQPRFSDQQQKDVATSEEVKGAEAEAIREQLKASQINAERLPGLTDPNAPQASQPGGTSQPAKPGQAPGTPTPATAPPAPKLLPTIHPDRFSPGTAPTPNTGSEPNAALPKAGASPSPQSAPKSEPPSQPQSDSQSQPERKP